MNAEYCFHTPAQLNFGKGIIKKIVPTLRSGGHRKILIVTDANLVKTGIPGNIASMIADAGLEYVIYDGIKENPTEDNVHQGRDLVLTEGCDAVLAVGGGSPIDAAKAISMLSAQGGFITEYEYGLKPVEKKGPLVYLVPTTSGTGSEATFWSVITDQKTHRKFDVGSPLMAAAASFIDPELTYGLPPGVTAATGMDALCHAMEAYVTKNHWPTTKALALEAMKLISANLLTAYQEPENEEARSAVMLGSMTAGMSFPNTGLGAVHGLTAPLGGHFGVPHGVANAIMLPIVMEYNSDLVADAYAETAAAMSCREKSAAAAIELVREMNRSMNIPGLSKYGITEEDLPLLAKDALGRNSNCNSNPVELTEEQAVELYRKAL